MKKTLRSLQRLCWQIFFFHLFLSHKHRRENNLDQTQKMGHQNSFFSLASQGFHTFWTKQSKRPHAMVESSATSKWTLSEDSLSTAVSKVENELSSSTCNAGLKRKCFHFTPEDNWLTIHLWRLVTWLGLQILFVTALRCLYLLWTVFQSWNLQILLFRFWNEIPCSYSIG